MNKLIKRRKDDGFTLIELMIVIAVIGILAVVLVPKMSGIKTGAKVTGVQTNAASVQAYVVSSMDKWINKGLANDAIATKISAQFSADNALKNPLSGETKQTSNIATTVLLTQTDKSTGIAGTPTAAITTDMTKTDALQILSAAPSTPYATGAGTVVVVVPATVTNGIQIIGYDDQGNVVDSVQTIKP